jgi:hypothetical protein
MNANTSTGHMTRLLFEEPFWQMFESFQQWRIDSFMREMDAKRQKGRVLPFVRGLRLSAQLIYVIRRILGTGTGLTANWGHLIDPSENFCSCECDVIIHHTGGEIWQWNGNPNPVMDFRFIRHQDAVAVISCKSYLRSGNIDTEYCRLMEPFVKRIWLFAECCGPRSVETIRNKALECGYENFWHLYTWSKQQLPQPNRTGWSQFIQAVRQLPESGIP